MALNSKTFICSPEWRHCQPVTSFHRHNFDGTLDRSRWNFTWGSLAAVTIKSSPFMDTKPNNFNSSGFSKVATSFLFVRRGGRNKMPYNEELFPGVR